MTNPNFAQQFKDRVEEMKKREDEKIRRGLYRRYDNRYVIVTDISSDLILNCATNRLVTYYFIDLPDKLYSTEYEEFVGDRYVVFNGDDCTFKPILSHPNNVTGQETMFKRVDNIDHLEKSMSTQELMAELRTRKDCPLYDLDIEGLNDKVDYVDYPVARHMYTDGEFMDIEVVYDNEREAVEFNASFDTDGKMAYNTYKRTWNKVN